MKIMYYLLSASGILLFGIGLLVALLPTRLTIRTQSAIKVPPSQLYNKVVHLSTFHLWSPWIAQDPDQKHYLTGQDGQIGSQYHWQGVAVAGHGSQTITNIVPAKKVVMDCHIKTPFESKPTFSYSFQPAQNGQSTEVELVFQLETGRPFNLISRLINLEGQIRTQNQLALQNLKGLCEAEALTNLTNHPTTH